MIIIYNTSYSSISKYSSHTLIGGILWEWSTSITVDALLRALVRSDIGNYNSRLNIIVTYNTDVGFNHNCINAAVVYIYGCTLIWLSDEPTELSCVCGYISNRNVDIY